MASVDGIGRVNLQLIGFLGMTVFMAALTGTYYTLLNPNLPSYTPSLTPFSSPSTPLTGTYYTLLNPNLPDGSLNPSYEINKGAWIAMYALTFFFANFGPNATTFIIPGMHSIIKPYISTFYPYLIVTLP